MFASNIDFEGLNTNWTFGNSVNTDWQGEKAYKIIIWKDYLLMKALDTVLERRKKLSPPDTKEHS